MPSFSQGPTFAYASAGKPAARQPHIHPQGDPGYGAPRLASPFRFISLFILINQLLLGSTSLLLTSLLLPSSAYAQVATPTPTPSSSSPVATTTFFYDSDGALVYMEERGNETVINDPHSGPLLKTTYIFGSYEESYTSGNSTLTTKRLTLPLTTNTSIVKDNSTTYLISKDYLGSTRVVVKDDGTTVPSSQNLSYYPYGTGREGLEGQGGVEGVEKSLPTDRLYTGQRKLLSGNLYYYNSRFYSPSLGTFIQPDTVEGMNRYAYVNNNPIMSNDPTGKCPQCLVGFLATAVDLGFQMFDEHRTIVPNRPNSYDVGRAISVGISAATTLGIMELGAQRAQAIQSASQQDRLTMALSAGTEAAESVNSMFKGDLPGTAAGSDAYFIDKYLAEQAPNQLSREGYTTVYRGVKDNPLNRTELPLGMRNGKFTLEELLNMPASKIHERLDPTDIETLADLRNFESQFSDLEVKGYLHGLWWEGSPFTSFTADPSTISLNRYIVKAKIPSRYLLDIDTLSNSVRQRRENLPYLFSREKEFALVGPLQPEWMESVERNH